MSMFAITGMNSSPELQIGEASHADFEYSFRADINAACKWGCTSLL